MGENKMKLKFSFNKGLAAEELKQIVAVDIENVQITVGYDNNHPHLNPPPSRGRRLY
ncbi:MAG: hypothetical protein HQ551_12760 [Desulfobacteraceae bacterium]|nr:hypothetical protein [Desulfobacteraceae bacterium]